MIKAKSKIIKMLLLVAAVLVTLLGVIYVGRDLAPEGSSALFGGKLESGYPFAGYSIAYNGGKITTCGVTFLNSSTVVTAAHCIPSGAEMYVGTGEFKPARKDNIKVNNFVVNTAWIGKPDNDIAVLNLSTNVDLSTFATVSTPKEGCNYEIVGYGQNESTIEGDFRTKLRKSIQVCIEDIVGNIAYMKGSDGGICYGDSGSPVFEKSTNRIVGIVSSIISSSKDKSSYCAVNNIGAIVLPKGFEGFILSSQFSTNNQGASTALCGSSCISSNECASGLTCNNSKCVTSNATCIVESQAYCAPSLGIECGANHSCIGNSCIPSSELNEEAVAEVFEGINPVIIAGLLAAVVFTILVLLLIPSKRS